jgi:hypothetical protein
VSHDYLDDPELLKKIIRQTNDIKAMLSDSKAVLFMRQHGIDGSYEPEYLLQLLATIFVIKQELMRSGEDSLERRRQLQSHLRFCERLVRSVQKEMTPGSALSVFTQSVLDANVDSD